MTRPKPGQPSPWANLPATPIRLPNKFHKELKAVAKLLDSGAIAPVDLLLIQPKEKHPPTPENLKASIEVLAQAITLTGDSFTALELGLLVATLETAAKEVDQVFAKKAKAEAMSLISNPQSTS